MAYTTILPTARTADDADIPAVELRGLEVTYGSHRVLDGVNLAVRAGQGLALLGLEVAGKTTAIKVMTTLVRPTGAPRAWPGTTSSPRRAKSASPSP